jgi:acetyl esterase
MANPTAPLDPVVAFLLRAIPARDDQPDDPELLRAEFRRLSRLAPYRGSGKAGGIVDFALEGGLHARLYRPLEPPPVPTVVFFHGGGWVVGDIECYDPQCRRLRDYTGAAVLSAEYRLAPEAPFPAAVQDAIAAMRWAARNVNSLGGDPRRLAVAGDSAGANLAAAVAQTLRSEIALRAQLLLYPGLDSTGLRSGEASLRYPSHETFANGYFLTLPRMNWYADRYLPNDDDRADPRASPLRAPDLRGVAAAVIATAGYDPLRDEGRAYADALRAANVPVTYLEFETLVHGFFGLASLSPGARSAARESCAAFAQLLS